jgi:hypothetical protein
VGTWAATSPCNATCGRGTRTYTRPVLQPQTGAGAACPALTDTEDCFVTPCVCSTPGTSITVPILTANASLLGNLTLVVSGDVLTATAAMAPGVVLRSADLFVGTGGVPLTPAGLANLADYSSINSDLNASQWTIHTLLPLLNISDSALSTVNVSFVVTASTLHGTAVGAAAGTPVSSADWLTYFQLPVDPLCDHVTGTANVTGVAVNGRLCGADAPTQTFQAGATLQILILGENLQSDMEYTTIPANGTCPGTGPIAAMGSSLVTTPMADGSLKGLVTLTQQLTLAGGLTVCVNVSGAWAAFPTCIQVVQTLPITVQGNTNPAATKGGSSFPVVWLALACVLTTIVVALAAAYFLGVMGWLGGYFGSLLGATPDIGALAGLTFGPSPVPVSDPLTQGVAPPNTPLGPPQPLDGAANEPPAGLPGSPAAHPHAPDLMADGPEFAYAGVAPGAAPPAAVVVVGPTPGAIAAGLPQPPVVPVY